MQYFEKLKQRLENNLSLYVGYPPNIHFDYSELFEFLQYPLNNLGDPFLMKSVLGTQEYEIAVIEWFLNLYGLKLDEGWGYVTNGGSEGILFGLWNAREHLENPIVYYSQSAHYAVPKAINILKLPSKIIRTDKYGVMDYGQFEDSLETDQSAIILATLGSTMTSSIDDVEIIRNILNKKNVKSYIHADAAIDGMVLPFLDNKTKSFRLDEGVDSISISGHKIIGSPIPCGVVLTGKAHISSNYINIVKNNDNTISSSRNGFTPLILWFAIKKMGISGFKTFISKCIKDAERYCNLFNEHNIPAWRYNSSISIVLDKLPDELLKKWRAPTNEYWTTLTALPKLSEDKVMNIIDDYMYLEKNGCLKPNEKYTLFPNFSKDISLVSEN